MTGKMAEPLIEEKNWLNYAMVAAVFIAVGLLRWPIWWVLLVLIPISITIAWRTRQ
jgi:chromate transporter